MIAELFNQSVADNVEGLTRVKFDKKISAGETLTLLFGEHKKDILYIKLFDRLHNIRTIKYMKPEKIKKIIDETSRDFVLLAMYLEVNKVEEELYNRCQAALGFIKNFLQNSRDYYNY